MPKLKAEVIKTRLEFARSVNWDHIACSKAWRISRYNAKYFIKEYRPGVKHKQPEYENQRMFDLQALTRHEWCLKWDVPLWEYGYYLSMYERKHGPMATPEIRELWERDYWEKLG